jgi:hypothetical protein
LFWWGFLALLWAIFVKNVSRWTLDSAFCLALARKIIIFLRHPQKIGEETNEILEFKIHARNSDEIAVTSVLYQYKTLIENYLQMKGSHPPGHRRPIRAHKFVQVLQFHAPEASDF